MNYSDKEKRLMPSLLDREVSDKSEDAFGHRHYAEALRSLVEDEGHSPPYSIGLLGSWGTGKSTIKRLYLASLEDDAETDSEGKTRKERVHPVTFNAWRFGGSDIKRALLRHVYLELGGNERSLKDALFRQIERPDEEIKTWKEYLSQARKVFGKTLGLSILAALIAALAVFGLAWLFGVGQPLATTLALAVALGFAGYVLKAYLQAGTFAVPFRTP